MVNKTDYSTQEAYYYLDIPSYVFNRLKALHAITPVRRLDSTNYYSAHDINKLKIVVEAEGLKKIMRASNKPERKMEDVFISKEEVKLVQCKLGAVIQRDIDEADVTVTELGFKGGILPHKIFRVLAGGGVSFVNYIIIALALGLSPDKYVNLYYRYIMEHASANKDIEAKLKESVYAEPTK